MLDYKMENGIKIIPGQVFETIKYGRYAILSVMSENKVLAFGEEGMVSIDLSTLKDLIYCPVMGEMTDYDVISCDQKDEVDQPPVGSEFWAQGEWNDGYGLCWSMDVWRVPKDFKWESCEQKNKSLKMSKVIGDPISSLAAKVATEYAKAASSPHQIVSSKPPPDPRCGEAYGEAASSKPVMSIEIDLPNNDELAEAMTCDESRALWMIKVHSSIHSLANAIKENKED